jgi:hypothetical protein
MIYKLEQPEVFDYIMNKSTSEVYYSHPPGTILVAVKDNCFYGYIKSQMRFL